MKLITSLLLTISFSALAHSGRTDSSGCHNDRKTGGYHCHRSDSTPSSNGRSPANNENEAEEEQTQEENNQEKAVD